MCNLAVQNREACSSCSDALGKIFTEILTQEIQAQLVEEIQTKLGCPTDDIFCSEDGSDLLLSLGKHVGFSLEEAEAICNDMVGACQKSWTSASCVDDLNAILYPRLTDEANKERLVQKMQDEYSVLLDQLVNVGEDEDHWAHDIDELVGTFTDIFNDLGAGLLCSLVGNVLN